jgi:hypothetical protein
MTFALQKQYGLCKKKIKDVYPKKVDHMLKEYVKKKEKGCIPKEGMPRLQGMSKKIDDSSHLEITRERKSCKRVHLLITKNIPHTCTS